MQQVDIDDVTDWMGPATVKRSLSGALDAEHVAINYYELDPGESFAFGYH
jgi:rubrerythrin